MPPCPAALLLLLLLCCATRSARLTLKPSLLPAAPLCLPQVYPAASAPPIACGVLSATLPVSVFVLRVIPAMQGNIR